MNQRVGIRECDRRVRLRNENQRVRPESAIRGWIERVRIRECDRRVRIRERESESEMREWGQRVRIRE